MVLFLLLTCRSEFKAAIFAGIDTHCEEIQIKETHLQRSEREPKVAWWGFQIGCFLQEPPIQMARLSIDLGVAGLRCFKFLKQNKTKKQAKSLPPQIQMWILSLLFIKIFLLSLHMWTSLMPKEKAYLKFDGGIVFVYLSVFIREMTFPSSQGSSLLNIIHTNVNGAIESTLLKIFLITSQITTRPRLYVGFYFDCKRIKLKTGFTISQKKKKITL